jgi:hypothetical protein
MSLAKWKCWGLLSNFKAWTVALCRHLGEGGYEQPFRHSFMVYLTARKLVDVNGVQEMLPGFDQHLPAECSGLPLLFSAEHYQCLEIAVTNVRWQYLNVGLSYY